MLQSLLNQAKQQGKKAVSQVRRQVEDSGKSFAQQKRDELLNKANTANMRKRMYRR